MASRTWRQASSEMPLSYLGQWESGAPVATPHPEQSSPAPRPEQQHLPRTCWPPARPAQLPLPAWGCCTQAGPPRAWRLSSRCRGWRRQGPSSLTARGRGRGLRASWGGQLRSPGVTTPAQGLFLNRTDGHQPCPNMGPEWGGAGAHGNLKGKGNGLNLHTTVGQPSTPKWFLGRETGHRHLPPSRSGCGLCLSHWPPKPGRGGLALAPTCFGKWDHTWSTEVQPACPVPLQTGPCWIWTKGNLWGLPRVPWAFMHENVLATAPETA